MIKNGRQVLITNEFDEETNFYTMCDYEEHIARIAEHYNNSYQISVSSGQSPVYDPEIHCGGVDKIRASQMFIAVSFNSFLLGRRKLQARKKKAKPMSRESEEDDNEEEPSKRRTGNFLMFYETVDEWQELDSQLTAQIADVLFTYHDKQFFTLVIPDCFHELDGWYPDMKRVVPDE